MALRFLEVVHSIPDVDEQNRGLDETKRIFLEASSSVARSISQPEPSLSIMLDLIDKIKVRNNAHRDMEDIFQTILYVSQLDHESLPQVLNFIPQYEQSHKPARNKEQKWYRQGVRAALANGWVVDSRGVSLLQRLRESNGNKNSNRDYYNYEKQVGPFLSSNILAAIDQCQNYPECCDVTYFVEYLGRYLSSHQVHKDFHHHARSYLKRIIDDCGIE